MSKQVLGAVSSKKEWLEHIIKTHNLTGRRVYFKENNRIMYSIRCWDNREDDIT